MSDERRDDMEEKLPPEDEMQDDPDTDTGDEAVPQAIPVAEPTVSSEPSPEPTPAVPTPPRVFPQQYTILMASTFMLAGTLTVWERAHVVGRDLYGFQSIGGGLVFALALYSVLTAVIGLLRGGVKFGAPLLTAFFALYFGIRSLIRIAGAEAFLYFGDMKAKHGLQKGLEAFLGQFGPGVYLEIIGGLMIFWLFFKAMFGGKKQEEAAASRRRGRR